MSVVQRINEHSTINQFKYFKVLIQEFHVKADIGLINCLVKFFEADSITDEEEVLIRVVLEHTINLYVYIYLSARFVFQLALFQKDQEVTKDPLWVYVSSVTSQDFFDSVHFTPFKVIFAYFFTLMKRTVPIYLFKHFLSHILDPYQFFFEWR